MEVTLACTTRSPGIGYPRPQLFPPKTWTIPETSAAAGAVAHTALMVMQAVRAAASEMPADRPFRVELAVDFRDRTGSFRWASDDVQARHVLVALLTPSNRTLGLAGSSQWTARRWKHGNWRLYASKEVGPPPWTWPHVGIWTERWEVSGLAGWRMTAYRLTVAWKERDA